MQKAVYGKLMLLAVLTALVGSLVSVRQVTFAQESKPAQQSTPAGETTGSSPARSVPRGRLPAYFSSVVSSEQRDKIYTIQKRYADQLVQLQGQIEQLIAERDRVVDEVLTAEQLAIVNKKREEAQKRREARRAERQPSTP